MEGDAGKVTREYIVSMDIHGLSTYPGGGGGGGGGGGDGWKLLGNPWISMDCLRTPCGEMAGKFTQEYIVSMVHGSIIPWTVHAPHGGITHSNGISIARSLNLQKKHKSTMHFHS